MNILDTIKKSNPNLKKEEISGLLYLIKNNKDLSNNQLIQLTGLPKEELKRFKISIHHLLKDASSDVIQLNEDGAATFKDVSFSPFEWSLLSYEDVSLTDKLIDIRKDHNLKQKREYDQWFATEESSVNKFKILKAKGCIDSKNILLLGDDDLLSIVLSLAKVEFNKVTVLDTDADLLSTIKNITTAHTSENVLVEQYDVRKELNNKHFKQYDVVVTDPPYTKAGVTLFLNRAIEALNGNDKYIFLYFGNSFKSPEKFLKIQEIINRAGLVIEDKIDKFVRYNGAESIGSASSVYILKTTPFTSTLPMYDLDKIYTYDVSSEEKFPYVDHVVLKVNRVPKSLMKSKSTLHNLLNRFCTMHRLKVVDTKITDFSKGGITFTFILANSNLIVHTWPEFDALHMDLVTCSPIFKKESLHVSIGKLFHTNYIQVANIE